MTKRATPHDEWGEQANVGEPINSPHHDGNPVMSVNGLTLFFSSWRPGGLGGSDIWMTKRATPHEEWGPAVNLGETVNSLYGDGPRGISEDELTLVFGSGRPRGLGTVNVWMTTRPTRDGEWSTPVNVNLGAAFNTEYVAASSGTPSPDFPAIGSSLYLTVSDSPVPLEANVSIYELRVVAPIPEPSTMTLLLGGSLCLLIHVSTLWRKRG